MTAPLQLVNYHPEELTAYHKNPRHGDTDAIARSLETNGQYRPIVVNLGTHTGRPLEVLAGNHTRAAALQLGWDSIAATTIDVDDHQAARIVAADNRTADLGGYDNETLIGLLQGLDDLDGTGYTSADLDDLLHTNKVVDLDDLAEELGEPGADDHWPRITLKVSPVTADQWRDHAAGFDSDDEALTALLDQ